jgi:hypothetical protein
MRKKVLILILMAMGLFNLLKGQTNLKQIDISQDSDFIDLQLTVTRYWQDKNKNHVCQVKGLWKKDTVCFEIAFRPDMQIGIYNNDVDKSRFYHEGIIFYSTGKQSDNFIKALISLFGTDNKQQKMNYKTSATSFILAGHPENISTDYIKTKIFFDDTDEKGFYSEWFVNIDLNNRIIELREKDPEYRKNIINILTN